MTNLNAINPSIVTRDTPQIAQQTGNLYKGIVVVSKRARQISTRIKEELQGKLAEFATSVDNLEEVFENREQIEISKHYERMPKPSTLAVEEYLDGKVFFRDLETREEIEQEADYDATSGFFNS